MAAIRLYLDANIFIYAFENDDAVAKKLLELVSLESIAKFLVTSEFTLSELMVDPFRKNDERLIDIYDNLTIGNAFIKVGTVTRDVLWHAALLRAEHASLRLPDAIHLSTAMHFGCTHFTADRRLKGTYPIWPSRQVLFGQIAAVLVIRPEISTLDQLIGELTR